jgi:hypothetical protein
MGGEKEEVEMILTGISRFWKPAAFAVAVVVLILLQASSVSPWGALKDKASATLDESPWKDEPCKVPCERSAGLFQRPYFKATTWPPVFVSTLRNAIEKWC